MHHLRVRLTTVLALMWLALISANPIAAQSNGNGSGNALGHDKKNPPSAAATPELGSLVLFGIGAAGVASYALMRSRAGRRQDEDQESPVSRT
jgi:hypothetical protein